MTKKSCSLTGNVINKEGKIVTSKLWEDLMRYSGHNYNLSKQYWKLFHKDGYAEQELKNLLGDKAKFDENGEFTFGTLHRYADMTEIEEKEFSEKLQNEIPKGPKSFDQAMAFLNDFRQNSQFYGEYMPYFTVEKGKCHLTVVPKNEANKKKLNEEVRKLSVKERIVFYLNRAGVAADFIDGGSSRYSTENIDQAADGLYHLVRIASGEQVTEDMAEEAGHFAFAAMGDNPIAKRLLKLMQDDATKIQVLKYLDPSEAKDLGVEEDRELAGALVGKALLNKLEHYSIWARMANRLATIIKKTFYTIKKDEVKLAFLEANTYASQIANGFISHHFTGTVQNALNYKETRYRRKSENRALYETTISCMENLASVLKPLNAKRARNISKFLMGLKATGNLIKEGTDSNTITQAIIDGKSLECIALTLDALMSELPDIQRELAQIDMNLWNMKNLEYGKTIRAAYETVHTLEMLINQLNVSITNITGNAKDIKINRNNELESLNLFSLKNQVWKYLHGYGGNDGLVSIVTRLYCEYALNFAKETLGMDHIERGKRMAFEKVYDIEKKKSKRGLVRKAAQTMTVEDLMEYGEDINVVSAYLLSPVVSPDIMNQVVQKAIQQAHRRKTINSISYIDRLRNLLQELKNTTGSEDTSWMYEYELNKDDSGHTKNLTGNFKTIMTIQTKLGQVETCINYGAWERDWEERKRQAIEDYRNNPDIKAKSRTYTSYINKVMEIDYMKTVWEDWNKQHSVQVTEVGAEGKLTKRFIPNNLYQDDEAYLSMSEAQRAFLKKAMKFKLEIETQMLFGHHSKSCRAPQFKGSTIERVSHKGTQLWQALKDEFIKNANDDEFGSEETDLEEQFYDTSATRQTKVQIDKLPLYGLKKLENLEELSTDFFHTMGMYIDMVCTYEANSLIVNDCELLCLALQEKRKGRTAYKDEQNNSGYTHTRAYKQFRHVLDVNLYNHVYGKLGSTYSYITKPLSFLTRITTNLVLRWNPKGGIVNTGTGIIEMLKEAAVGEDFTMKNLLDAFALYVKEGRHRCFGFLSNPNDLNTHFGNNKVSLLIRYFDILGKNENINREWFTNNAGKWSKVFSSYNKLSLVPYGSGEHFMQTVSFLAVFMHHPLYELNPETGKITTLKLVDLYEVQHDNKGNYDYLERNTDKVIIKSPDLLDDYNRLQELKRLVKECINNNENIEDHLTNEQIQWLLKEYNLNTTGDMQEKFLNIINLEERRICFTEYDEVELINKARKKANDMHGLYDLANKSYVQTAIYSPLLMVMKGYVFGYLQRKAAPSHYSIVMDREEEGAWNSYFKGLLGAFFPIYEEVRQPMLDESGNPLKDKNGETVYNKDVSVERVCVNLMTKLLHTLELGGLLVSVNCLPVIGMGASKYLRNPKVQKRMKEWYGMSEHQLYNLRRVCLDASVGIALTLVRLALGVANNAKLKTTLATFVSIACIKILAAILGVNLEGDDKDEEEEFTLEVEDEKSKKWLAWMYYFTGRLDAEQNSYNPYSLTGIVPTLQEYQGVTSSTPLFVNVMGSVAKNAYNAIFTPKTVTSEETGEEYNVEDVLKESESLGLNLNSKDSYYGKSVWEQLKPYYNREITEDNLGFKTYKYSNKAVDNLSKYTFWRMVKDYESDPVQLLDGYYWGREFGN